MSASTVDIARLEAIVDACEMAERIETLLPVGVRPRQLTVATLLLGILLCLADGHPAHLARIHQTLIGLPEKDKRRLGVIVCWRSGDHQLTYRQVERTYGLIVGALSKEHPDGAPSEILSETADGLLQASLSVLGAPESSSLAIDWTDYESFACPPRKRRAGVQADTTDKQGTASTQAKTAAIEQEDIDRDASNAEEDEQPPCVDPEAAWGHRKTNHPGKSETFFGYYLQAATIVREENGPQVPELVARIQIASAKHDPPEQIVPVLERMAKDGTQIGDLLADCGYSYRQAETFAIPMRAAGAKLVIDLHPNDRGINGTHHGAIIAGGNLYCPATPKTLFELGPLAPGASTEQRAVHDTKTAELARYKLSAISATDQDGYRRACCPAVKGKVRCPSRPASLTLSHERPTITDPPQHPPVCCVQQTITIPPSVNAKTQQKHDWPSPSHRASYARRTACERSFSQICDPATTDTKRGWSRLTGLTPNALFLTCAFVIANVRTADAFAARQAENQRRAAIGLPPRKRAKRRRSIQDMIAAANAPPQIAA